MFIAFNQSFLDETMAGKVFLFVTCVFGAFLQIQTAAINKNEGAEYKPDVRYITVEVDDEELNLTLVQRLHQVFHEKTPVWSIRSVNNKNDDEITEIEFPEDKEHINGVFYGDDEHMATLLTSWDDDELEGYYNGVINIGTTVYKVESALDEWWRNPDVHETSNEKINSAESNEQKSQETVETSNDEVQSKESDEKSFEETAEVQELKLRSSYVSKNGDSKTLEHSLKTLYPKILAVVDYDLYNELGQSVDKVIEYVATFWNAVDMKYSKLNSPEVKISVTGVLIVEDRRVSLTGGDTKNFNENFVKKTNFINYDTAFILSRSSIEARRGQTYLGLICDRKNSVALIEDDAGYKGLLSATHELGHLLNLPHDGMDRAEECTVNSEDDVTFMANGVETEKQLTWSSCSRNILREFSKSKAAACLQNYWRYD